MKALRVTRAAANAFIDDNATMHSAALAYYTLFSLAPLLIISITIAGFFFGERASRGEIFLAIHDLFGDAGAHAIEGMVHSTWRDLHTGLIATCIGIIALLFGATSAFSQLEQSLNLIWGVRIAPGKSVSGFLRQRFLSFSMVLVIGFLLLVSLVASAALAAMGKFMGSSLPGGEVFWHLANFGLSFAIITLLFAAILKILPDVKLEWRDVWRGAAMTAFLFSVGKFLIGLYLGKSGVASSYGAAGSVVMVLLWVYYSSLILFYGAEYTREYVRDVHRELQPKAGAEFMTKAA